MGYTSTILIVDDEPVARETLEALLFNQGYQLLFASNGTDALQQARTLTPDVILLDVMMPDIDGYEVCRRMRGDLLLAEVPIVIVTALDDRHARIQGFIVGADDVISKPFDRIELLARLRMITRINRYRRLLVERERFERVIALAPDGILIVGIDGVIHLTNRALLQMLGAEQEEQLLGQSIESLIVPAQRADGRNFIDQVVQGIAQVTQIETTFVRLSGISFPVEIDAGFFPWNEQPAVQLVVRDISNRKELQAKFLQAQKLESLGLLVNGVAHDFNNLLTIINTYTDLVFQQLPSASQMQSDLAEVNKASQRAADLIQRMLAFSRKQQPELQSICLDELITEFDTFLHRLLGSHIELITQPACGMRRIRVDQGQIEQVLVNLAVNARDAMPEGGRLQITTSIVVLDTPLAAHYGDLQMSVQPGCYALLSVSDSGVGMDTEIQRHLFEPFYTTKGPEKGTGLGLSTCYSIIQQHGGLIQLSSALNQGTTFKIFLPCEEAEGSIVPHFLA